MEKLPTRRFFVVIHTITNGLQHAFGEAKVAKWAGVDGVFLIPDYAKGNKKATTDDQFLYLEKLKEKMPDFLIGVNFLVKPETLIPRLYSVQPDLYQTDSSSSERIDKTRLPTTEFFLGLAFKYSRNVHLTGSITKDIYDKKHQEYADKLQLFEIELSEHRKADYDYQTTVASVLSVARRAKQIFESSEPHEKRAFLNYLLQNPTVNGKKLEFTMRSPFNLVLELASSPNWLRTLEDVRNAIST